MNWTIAASIGGPVLAALIVIIGWFASSALTARRDHRNRQTEKRIGYLTEAYTAMALFSSRVPNKERALAFETAIANIQLFGSPEEIAGLHAFIEDWAKTGATGPPRADLDGLLFLLRNSLRKELALLPVESRVRWIHPRGMFEVVESALEEREYKKNQAELGLPPPTRPQITPP